MERFLHEIVEKGCTSELLDTFIKHYGLLIRRNIAYHLRQHFPGQPIQTEEGIRGDLEDLAENTYDDVVMEIDRRDGNLIAKYLEYRRRQETKGKPYASFSDMLKKCVQYKFLDNYSPGLSQKELFDKVVDVKKEETRRYFIAEARQRHGDEVAHQLRSKFVELHAGTVALCVDYFFEVFLPREYRRLRENHGGALPRGQALHLLINLFTEDDCRKGSKYAGKVPHIQQGEIPWDEVGKFLEQEGEVLDTVPVQDELHKFWSELLLCQEPDPAEIEKELVRVRGDRASVLFLACARVKKNSSRADTRENLLIYAVWYLSQCHALPNREDSSSSIKLELRKVDFNQIRELGELSWKDCCQRFGKQVKKERVEDQLIAEIYDSPYRHMLSPSVQEYAQRKSKRSDERL
jgi:hypothetical protein